MTCRRLPSHPVSISPAGVHCGWPEATVFGRHDNAPNAPSLNTISVTVITCFWLRSCHVPRALSANKANDDVGFRCLWRDAKYQRLYALGEVRGWPLREGRFGGGAQITATFYAQASDRNRAHSVK